MIHKKSIANVEYINCSYGKKWKGLCGLKADQGSCWVIKALRKNFVDNLQDDYNELKDNIPDFGVSTAILKPVDIFRWWCKLNFWPMQGQPGPKDRH